MNTSIIRPGIMVSLKSTVSGGVSYIRHKLEVAEEDLPAREEAAVERWETKKTVEDAEEHDRATKTRSLALAKIKKCCASTAFGLLCPQVNEDELNAAIKEARELSDAYNLTAKFTKVYIYALKGRIASTDEEAARAIAGEVKSILISMDEAIDRLDPKAIRDAATKARELGAMLAPAQAEKVAEAVEAAREAARTITRRIEKKGEDAAIVLDDISRAAIEKARFAFMDFDAPTEIEGEALPPVEVGRFANGIDFAIGEGN